MWWSQRGGALWQCGRGWGHTKWCRHCLQAKDLPGLQNLKISKENKRKKKKKKLSMSGQVHDGMHSCRGGRGRGGRGRQEGMVGRDGWPWFEFEHGWHMFTCHNFNVHPDSAWMDFFFLAKSSSIHLCMCILNQIKLY